MHVQFVQLCRASHDATSRLNGAWSTIDRAKDPKQVGIRHNVYSFVSSKCKLRQTLALHLEGMGGGGGGGMWVFAQTNNFF